MTWNLENLWRIVTRQTISTSSRSAVATSKEPHTDLRQLLSVQEITIRKKRALILPENSSASLDAKMQLQYEAINLGFIFSEAAVSALVACPEQIQNVFNVLQKLVGADKVWNPMYPDFPMQVFSAADTELFSNAYTHYLSRGTWLPTFFKTARVPLFSQTMNPATTETPIKLKQIGLVNQQEYFDIFTELLTSNASLSSVDRDVIHSYIQTHTESELSIFLPETIPFKETLAQVVAEGYLADYPSLYNQPLKTATDVLRVATCLSQGDVSLAGNSRFKLSRPQRKWLVRALEPLIIADDVFRHGEKWKRLFHCIHIGSFEIAPRSREIAAQLRAGKLRGHNSVIEYTLEEHSSTTDTLSALLTLLNKRPGEFARRLDHLLRSYSKTEASIILEAFQKVAHTVDTRVLVQMLGHFMYRKSQQFDTAEHGTDLIPMTRVAIPRGQIAQVQVLKNPQPAIDNELLESLLLTLKQTLLNIFATRAPLGKVWIDPLLKRSPAPLQMRAAAEGLQVVQRGTRLAMPDTGGDILRFFVHWIGSDIDLSACFLTEELKFHSEIAYYALRGNPKSQGYKAAHSGDITYAPTPDGACEFIDIDLNSIQDRAIRYITMDVRVYEGATFPAQKANAGWMFRRELGQEGEIFDARTVEQRISIGAASYSCMVAVFDLTAREVIWLDLLGTANRLQSGNNVANNRFNIEDLLEASINFHQLSLYDLLLLHVQARGELVLTPAEADQIFGNDLVVQSSRINAEFL